jgi:hypothetical protein
MTPPTQGETFAKLVEHLRLAQEDAAMLGHLAQAQGDKVAGLGWLAYSEGLKLTIEKVTKLAMGRLQ